MEDEEVLDCRLTMLTKSGCVGNVRGISYYYYYYYWSSLLITIIINHHHHWLSFHHVLPDQYNVLYIHLSVNSIIADKYLVIVVVIHILHLNNTTLLLVTHSESTHHHHHWLSSFDYHHLTIIINQSLTPSRTRERSCHRLRDCPKTPIPHRWPDCRVQPKESDWAPPIPCRKWFHASFVFISFCLFALPIIIIDHHHHWP